MGAIGDYIHWSYSGYVEKKGHQEEPYFDSAQKIIDNRNDILNRWIKQQGKKTEAKKLEQEMDKILQQLKTFKDKNRISNEEYQECHKQLKMIKDLFDLNDYDEFKNEVQSLIYRKR